MHVHTLERWEKSHDFFDAEAAAGHQRRVVGVVVLTAAAMVVEIAGGVLWNSMALLADGWHMASHAAALGVTAFAFWFARRHADDRRFSFGPWKVGVLGGFASAVVLAVVAAMMAFESGARLIAPRPIAFDQAIAVAVFGLAVNLLSAWMLRGRPHGHDDGHDHARAHDHNMRAAYVHVLTDALTSVLAIAALTAGRFAGWVWLDPLAGLVGAAVIGAWAWGLMRSSGRVLVDADADLATVDAVRHAIEADADNAVADLHVWRVGARHHAAMVSLVTHAARPVEHYKALLAGVPDLGHVTIEVHVCPGEPCRPAKPGA